jgi:hypothetical protein
MHSEFVIAIIFRCNQPLRCIRADHKRRAPKQARLFHEGGRSREFDRRLPGELREPVSHRLARQRRLVDVCDRDFDAKACCLSSSATQRRRKLSPLVDRINTARPRGPLRERAVSGA